MTRFLIFAACVLALLTTISVLAQDPQGQPGPRRRGGHNGEKRMKSMDINNDGVISRDEWKGKPEVFNRIDKNGDGSLTREEFGDVARRQGGPIKWTRIMTGKFPATNGRAIRNDSTASTPMATG